jgi:hypothetical protein
MINWIALAVLAGTPASGDVVATWVHVDADARIEITLAPDGGCLIESVRQFNGTRYRELCAYSVSGSTVQVRTKGDAKGHDEFMLILDPRTDEMKLGNVDDGAKFYRTRFEKR